MKKVLFLVIISICVGQNRSETGDLDMGSIIVELLGYDI